MGLGVKVVGFVGLVTLLAFTFMGRETGTSVKTQALNAVEWFGTPAKKACTYMLADHIQQRVNEAVAALDSTVDSGQRRNDENFRRLFEALYNETVRRDAQHGATLQAIGDVDAMARQRGEQIEEVKANFTAYQNRMHNPTILLAMPSALFVFNGGVSANLVLWAWFCFCMHALPDSASLATWFIWPIIAFVLFMCIFSSDFGDKIDAMCRRLAARTHAGTQKLWVWVSVNVHTQKQPAPVTAEVAVATGTADAIAPPAADEQGPLGLPEPVHALLPTAPTFLSHGRQRLQPQRLRNVPPPPYQPIDSPYGEGLQRSYRSGARRSDSESEED